MKQLWHKAKALFGFGPQEFPRPMTDGPSPAEISDALLEAQQTKTEVMRAALDARFAVMAQPIKDEHGYIHRTSWEADHLNPAE